MQDAIQERRRAKAMKLLDAKMAELSKEPESWEDVRYLYGKGYAWIISRSH